VFRNNVIHEGKRATAAHGCGLHRRRAVLPGVAMEPQQQQQQQASRRRAMLY